MALDPINVAKVPLATPAGQTPTADAAAPATAGPTAAPADQSWVARAEGWLDAAKEALPSMTTLANVATAAVSPLVGLGALAGKAIRIWTKASQLKTQAFLDANLAKFSPAAQEALQKLANKGVLDMVDPGWNNLRDNLDAWLKAGGDMAVAEAAIAQIAAPNGAITQSTRSTCVAATVQFGIASDNPAQYFKMATELAATGQTTLPNGDRLTVSARNLAYIDQQGLAGAARMNAVFQAALMDYASGGGYDMATDLTTTTETTASGGEMTSVMHGLRATQARKLNDALLQTPILDGQALISCLAACVAGGGVAIEQARTALATSFAEALKTGHGGVMVVVSAGSEEVELPPLLKRLLGEEDWKVPRFHMVLVKGVKDDVVTYVDPTGTTRSEPLADFAKRICTDESVYVGANTSASGGQASGSGRGR